MLSKKLFKILVTGLNLFFCGKQSFSQGQWVWEKGSNTPNPIASYGIQGVPSASNNPPGLYEFNNWVDSQGNLWIFGGLDVNGDVYSDLWKYNPATNDWTW